MSLIIDIALIVSGVLLMYALANQMHRHLMHALDNFRDRNRVSYHTRQLISRLAAMFLLAVGMGVLF